MKTLSTFHPLMQTEETLLCMLSWEGMAMQYAFCSSLAVTQTGATVLVTPHCILQRRITYWIWSNCCWKKVRL